jgi:hypothetical protein
MTPTYLRSVHSSPHFIIKAKFQFRDLPLPLLSSFLPKLGSVSRTILMCRVSSSVVGALPISNRLLCSKNGGSLADCLRAITSSSAKCWRAKVGLAQNLPTTQRRVWRRY